MFRRTRYPPAVIDESFFLTVAGIAMSFAGFAGLMNALRSRGESWAPIELYQLRIIVAYAITTLFGALSTFALGLGNMLSDMRLGHGTPIPTRVRATFTTITVLGVIALLGTAISGALPVYRIALILMLAMPAGTFVYVVARIKR